MKKNLITAIVAVVFLSAVGWRYNAVPAIVQSQIDANTATTATVATGITTNFNFRTETATGGVWLASGVVTNFDDDVND